MLKYEPVPIKPFCLHPFRRLKIDAYGGVSHCCYQEHGSLGNIIEHDLEFDIWEGETNREVRRYMIEGELHPKCVGWGGCPFIGSESELGPSSGFRLDGKYPLCGLEIDFPPTHCNIGGEDPDPVTSPACIMCCRNQPGFIDALKPHSLDAILRSIKPLMPELEELAVIGNAEPFWKGALFDAFDKLDYISHNRHCRFWTYTNGTIFDQKVMEKYVEYVRTSSLNFSIDAATPETYIKIRRLNLYETIKRNIKAYSSYKPIRHRIRIYNVLNRLNFREMPLMVEEAEEMGADVVAFGLVHSAGGLLDRKTMESLVITEEDLEEYERCAEEAHQIASQSRVELESNLGLLIKDFRGQTI